MSWESLKGYLKNRIDHLKRIIESMPKHKHSEVETILMAKLDAFHEVVMKMMELEK